LRSRERTLRSLKEPAREAIIRSTVDDTQARRNFAAPDQSATADRALKRVLFVDDERDVLDGLRDALRRYRRVWSMRFALSGAEALAELEIEPADVIVSDIQMPGMDGTVLLARVQELYPATIRLVLSGYANTQVVAHAARVAHRILAKPCSVDELSLVVQRSCALHEVTERAELYRVTAGATTLPSGPGLYMEITEAITDPTTGPQDIARIIERDPAMTAKLLQLANSAFFGIGRTVNRIRDAVVYLGTDTIKALTLSAEAFGKLAPTDMRGFSIEEFQTHATLVARIAGGILPHGPAQQDAITAALVHDIGQLICIADDRARWQLLSEEARRRGLPLYQVELEAQGITHAATGAYLLSLWGIPDGVVEAVAHHHDPCAVPGAALDAVAAVHIADALAHEVQQDRPESLPHAPLDTAFLEALGVEHQLEQWRQLARSAVDAAAKPF
jgi:HD-like signal output (HDOD) protein/ActR/RegA family two-component response regulator